MPYQPEPITWQFDPETPAVAAYQQEALEFALDALAAIAPGTYVRLHGLLCEHAADLRDGRDDGTPDGFDALANLLEASR